MALVQPTTAVHAVNTLPALWLQQLAANSADSSVSWLEPIKKSALAEMAAAGRLPGRKDERWKYFSLLAMENAPPHLGFVKSGVRSSQAAILANLGGVFLPLQLGAELEIDADIVRSLPAGLRLLNLKQAASEPQLAEQLKKWITEVDLKGPARLFEALNTASLDDALLVHVAAGADAARLHVEWLAGEANRLNNFRIFVVLEKGAQLQLLETWSQSSAVGHINSVANMLWHIELAESAQLDHLRVQSASAEQHLLQFVKVSQSSASRYRYTGFEMGGGLVRNDIDCQLNGPGATADLAAAFIGNGDSCIDHHIVVDHHATNCSSEQNFRGVLGGRSRGVFNGKALIRPGADGSSVRQSNANLLLSDSAEMNTKPELEIYADEVEASHGATVGQLDELALFYLQSRGLNRVNARRMLTGAFCRAIGNRLSDRKLAERIEAMLDAAMPALAGSDEELS